MTPRPETGDVVILKKPHPCGSVRFEVVRTGADFKLRCCGCGSTVLLDHDALKKRIRRKEDGNAVKAEKE